MADIAWSEIQAPDGVVKPGDTVNATKLGLSKEDMEELREAGAIRDTPYPKDIGQYESPREYNLRKVNEAVAQAEAGVYVEVGFRDDQPFMNAEEEKSSGSK